MTAAGQGLTQEAARFSLRGLAQGFRERQWLVYGAYTLFAGSVLTAATARGIAGLKPGEVLLALIAGSLVVRRLIRKDYSFAVTPVDIAFVLLLVAGTLLPLLKAVLSGLYISKDMINALAGPIEYFLWYRIMLEAVSLPSKLPNMTRVILVVISFISIIGVLQIIKFPGVENFLLSFFPTYETSESPRIHRATSLVGGWEILAAIAAYGILLINQIQTTDEGVKTLGKRWNWILIGFLGFNVVALLSTLSTAGFIAIALGYILAWRLNGKLSRTTLYALGAAVVGGLALIPFIVERLNFQFGTSGGTSTHHSGVPTTWVARATHWDIVLHTVLLHPASIIFGVQPNFNYPVLAFGSTESLYLLLLYRGGIIYLAAFAAFIAIVGRYIWQVRQKAHGFNRQILTGIFVILIVNFTIDVLDAHFFSAGEWQILMTLIALAVGLDLRTDNFETAVAPAQPDEPGPTATRIPAVKLPSSWDGRLRLGLVGVLVLTAMVGGAGWYKDRHKLAPATPLTVPYYNPDAPVSVENQLFGADTWQIDSGADTTFIQGYAGAASALPGQTVPLYISTKHKTAYDIAVYRMGWYRGLGARLMQSAHIAASQDQTQGYWTPKTGLVGCTSCDNASTTATHLLDAHWQQSYALTIGRGWPSGMYLVKLTAADVSPQGESYIPLVVRNDSSDADILVSLPFSTYQAYNAWGGYSLYGQVLSPSDIPAVVSEQGKTFDQRAQKVSFNRPYSEAAGTGGFLDSDIHTIRWLERAGFDVSYTTSTDVNDHPEMLLHHAIFLSTGHDEYWTLAQRNGLERARAAGVNLAFFGAGDGYWQSRFEADAQGGADRTLVCYKVQSRKTAGSDTTTDPDKDAYSYIDKGALRSQTTAPWRDALVNRPENALLGLEYNSFFQFNPTDPYLPDWQVRNGDPDTIERSASLTQNQTISGGLLGYAFDSIANNGQTPANLVILGQSSVVDHDERILSAQTAYYRDVSGAIVFDAGTLWWSDALDEFSFPGADQPNLLMGSQPIEGLTMSIIRNMLYTGHVPVPTSQSVDAPQ